MENNKIPIETVREKRYLNNGFESLIVKEYYYRHYASPKEKEKMDREDKIHTIIAAVIFGVMLLGIPLSFILI